MCVCVCVCVSLVNDYKLFFLFYCIFKISVFPLTAAVMKWSKHATEEMIKKHASEHLTGFLRGLEKYGKYGI